MVSAYPEVIVEQIKPDLDFMIIACDGIWDCLTSQQAVDFVYQARTKMAANKEAANGSSPTTKATTSTATTRKSAGSSPTKRVSRPGGATTNKSPKKTPAQAATASSLSGILGLMMDKICPSNLASSEGLGADNMTGILIEFNKPGSDTV